MVVPESIYFSNEIVYNIGNSETQRFEMGIRLMVGQWALNP